MSHIVAFGADEAQGSQIYIDMHLQKHRKHLSEPSHLRFPPIMVRHEMGWDIKSADSCYCLQTRALRHVYFFPGAYRISVSDIAVHLICP